MTTRTRYLVEYQHDRAARFSNIDDAMTFARAQRSAEVFAPDGIVGQYRDGLPTPEFATHHAHHLERVGLPAEGGAWVEVQFRQPGEEYWTADLLCFDADREADEKRGELRACGYQTRLLRVAVADADA